MNRLGSDRMRALSLASALLTLVLISSAPEPAISQPTWDFLVQVSGGPLYPGETGTIEASLFNVNCVSRTPRLRFTYTTHAFLRNLTDAQLEELKGRLNYLRQQNLILDYVFAVNATRMVGPTPVADYTLVVTGACVGRSVHVKAVRVWFPWPGLGRALHSERSVERTLPPFDVPSYIATGSTSAFRIDLRFEFRVPKDLPSELLGSNRPNVEVDATVEGSTYTFGRPFGLPDVRVVGDLVVEPFRTFKLRLLDSEGRIPLSGAEVRLQAHVYAQYTLRLSSDREGYVAFTRLPERFVYSVTVLYKTPYTPDPIPVSAFDATALELARLDSLTTELYTLRLSAADMKGRPVKDGVARLRPIEVVYAAIALPSEVRVSNGTAEFRLVPTGNYTVSLEVMGFEVGSVTRYVGYHPTHGRLPPSVTMTASLDDISVTVRDGMGRPLAATVSLTDPRGRVVATVTSRDGRAEFVQLPVTTYGVRARANDSLGTTHVRELQAVPGASVTLSFPFYRLSVSLVTQDGKPLRGAALKVLDREIILRTGEASFDHFPGGSHAVSVTYKGVVVHESAISLTSDAAFQLRTRVYDVELRFLDASSKPLNVTWRVAYLDTVNAGHGAFVRLVDVPDVELRLEVSFRAMNSTFNLLSRSIRASEAWPTANFSLPVGDLALIVLWEDGLRLDGVLVLEVAGSRHSMPLRAGAPPRVPTLPFGEYGYSVVDARGLEVARGRISHSGSPVSIRVPQTSLTVKVSDQLGTPLPGARVSVLKSGLRYGTSTTDASGVVRFSGLPALLEPYEVVVEVDGHKVTTTALGEVALSVPVLVLFGAPLPLDVTVQAVLWGSLAVIAAAIAISLYRRRVPR